MWTELHEDDKDDVDDVDPGSLPSPEERNHLRPAIYLKQRRRRSRKGVAGTGNCNVVVGPRIVHFDVSVGPLPVILELWRRGMCVASSSSFHYETAAATATPPDEIERVF